MGHQWQGMLMFHFSSKVEHIWILNSLKAVCNEKREKEGVSKRAVVSIGYLTLAIEVCLFFNFASTQLSCKQNMKKCIP
jgi:hypothetical protein